MLAKVEEGGELEETGVVPVEGKRRSAREGEEVKKEKEERSVPRIVRISPLFPLQFLCQIFGNRLVE